jgi:hypothetical protein
MDDVPVVEDCLTVRDIAVMWGLSVSRVSRLFRNEPGVLKKFGEGGRQSKRVYISLRIPMSALFRVHKRRMASLTQKHRMHFPKERLKWSSWQLENFKAD